MEDETLTSEEVEERIYDLNPSAKLAYYILEQNGEEMLKSELEEETLLEDRTLRDAMDALEEERVGYSRKYVHDNKKRIYGLNTEEFDRPEISF